MRNRENNKALIYFDKQLRQMILDLKKTMSREQTDKIEKDAAIEICSDIGRVRLKMLNLEKRGQK